MTTVVTLTVGSNNRQYATLPLAWEAIPANLVAADVSYVIEAYNDSEFVATGKILLNGKITDASHTITIRPAAGQGWMDNPNHVTNRMAYIPANGVAMRGNIGYSDFLFIDNPYVHVFGLQISLSGEGGGQTLSVLGAGSHATNCLIENHKLSMYSRGLTLAHGASASNIGIYLSQSDSIGVWFNHSNDKAENITVFRNPAVTTGYGFGSDFSSMQIKNSISFGNAFSNRADFTGSHNASSGVITFGADNKQNLVAVDHLVNATAAAYDLRLKEGSILIDAGTVPSSSNTIAPGGNRQQGNAADIGAWEFPQAMQSPTATVTSITVNNQTVIITGVTTGVPTVGTCSAIPVVLAGNNGVAKGPIDLVFGAGTFTVSITDLKVGKYALALEVANEGFTVAGSNPIGSFDIEGAKALTVIQDPLNGQVLKIHGTTSGNPTSASLTVLAATIDPNGAIQQTVPVTLGVGTFTVSVTLGVGNYAAGLLTFTNNAGTSLPVPGTSPVSVMGFVGNPEAPPGDMPTVPVVTGVVITTELVTGSMALNALVSGVNSPSQEVLWATTLGQVTSTGVFTEPMKTNVIQNGLITATSVADLTKFDTVDVVIAAAAVVPNVPTVTSVVVAAQSPVVAESPTQQYTATVNGNNNPAQTVAWTVSLGQVSATGLVTKPAATNTVQTVTVTATSTVDPSKFGTITFTVAALPVDVPDPIIDGIQGTQVAMHFITPNGEPVADTDVEIQLKAADYIDSMAAIYMPRLVLAKTNEYGHVTVTLMPCAELYYVTVMDKASEAGLFYKFHVPEVDDPDFVVRLQDIVVDSRLSVSFDEAALLTIINAKANVMAAVAQVQELIDQLEDAIEAGGGIGGGGGGGSVGGGASPGPIAASGNRPEVLITADANGVLTLDGNVSNRFRFVMTKDTKIADPINFYSNEHIYLTGYQDIVGGRKMSYGLSLLLPAAQPYVPPLSPKAAFLMELRPTINLNTAGLNWAMWGFPDKGTPTGFGLTTELTKVDENGFFNMWDTFAAMTDEKTVFVQRNGLSAEVAATKVGIAGETYYIRGIPVIQNGPDMRPVLELLPVDFDIGGANRPAWGKGIFNFEGAGDFYVRDLVIKGTRAVDGTGRGISPNGAVNVYVNNVKFYNNNNGMMWGHMEQSGVYIADSEFDYNGIGTNGIEDGYTHNIYAGHSKEVIAHRSSFTRAQKGHDFKSRAAYTEIKQCLLSGSAEGRELEVPNGGRLLVENCIIEKDNDPSGQNDLCVIGQEGVEKDRPREYIVRNTRFVNHRVAGTTATFFNNMDTEVPCRLIDCEFIGEATLNRPDKGIPGCVLEFTGGPIGPLLPVGYQPTPMTPVV